MISRNLFDPLRYLERQLRLKVSLSNDGKKILLTGLPQLSQENRKKAMWVVKTYDRLLKIQLDAPKREKNFISISQRRSQA